MTSPSSPFPRRVTDRHGRAWTQVATCWCGWDGVNITLCECDAYQPVLEENESAPKQGRLDLREPLDPADRRDAEAASEALAKGATPDEPREGTKTAKVLALLRQGRWVSPLLAFERCGTLRYSGIIYALKHDYGIALQHRDVENDHGVRWREFALEGVEA